MRVHHGVVARRRSGLRSSMFRALCAATYFAIAPSLLTACTSIKDRTQSAAAQAVELGGLWMTSSFPCNGRLDTLLLGVEHKGKVLGASSTTQTACVTRGHLLWMGTLSMQRLTPSSLPVMLDVTVHLSGGDDLEGQVSIISSDRMELRFDDAVVVMKRGAGAEADDVEAEGGEPSRASGTAGSRAPSSDPSEWFCMNVLDSCTCVMNGAGPASCATKQPCCFSVRTFPTPNCQCWPTDSDSCRTRDTDPDKEPVASCPP